MHPLLYTLQQRHRHWWVPPGCRDVPFLPRDVMWGRDQDAPAFQGSCTGRQGGWAGRAEGAWGEHNPGAKISGWGVMPDNSPSPFLPPPSTAGKGTLHDDMCPVGLAYRKVLADSPSTKAPWC